MTPATMTMLSRYILDSQISAQRAMGEAQRRKAGILEQSQVYIGLNDSQTREQKLGTGHYVSILKDVCRRFGVPFSFDVVEGGYVHDDGEYTQEKSIVLTFIDVPDETVDKIAEVVRVLFNQESVLVTNERIRARSIRELPTQ